jgi:uncharacterized linocin/CFP29 family protein
VWRNVIDAKKNSADNKIFDAWESLEDTGKKTAQVESGKIESGQNEAGLGGILDENEKQSLQKEDNDVLMPVIQQWGGFSQKSVSDATLLKTIGVDAEHIPHWFKGTTRWVVNGDTSQQEFVDAVKYMYKNGIIK